MAIAERTGSTPTGIVQLTEDHTLVNELVRSGQISPEEAAHHPRRNVLTRALGTDAEAELDVQVLPWGPDDTLLLCSDGLTGMVSDIELLQTVQAEALLWKIRLNALFSLPWPRGATIILRSS